MFSNCCLCSIVTGQEIYFLNYRSVFGPCGFLRLRTGAGARSITYISAFISEQAIDRSSVKLCSFLRYFVQTRWEDKWTIVDSQNLEQEEVFRHHHYHPCPSGLAYPPTEWLDLIPSFPSPCVPPTTSFVQFWRKEVRGWRVPRLPWQPTSADTFISCC